MRHQKLVALILLGLFFQLANAQEVKRLKTSFEDARTKCIDRPLNERVAILVSTFDVANSYSNLNFDLGENMATILTNGLQEINCFKVLELRKNKAYLIDEIDGDEYMDKNKLPQKGKMLGAQVIVTGEITEFAEKKNNASFRGLSLGSTSISFGFVLKLIEPTTGIILWSKSINVQGKATGSAKVNIPLPGREILTYGTGQRARSNPAISDALEKGMFRACELLVAHIDQLELPEVEDPNLSMLTLTVHKTDFMQLRRLSKQVESLGSVSKTQTAFKNGIGTCSIKYFGEREDLVDRLFGGILNGYSVSHVGNRRNHNNGQIKSLLSIFFYQIILTNFLIKNKLGNLEFSPSISNSS